MKARCCACRKLKPLEAFHGHRRCRTGHAGRCKACVRAGRSSVAPRQLTPRMAAAIATFARTLREEGNDAETAERTAREAYLLEDSRRMIPAKRPEPKAPRSWLLAQLERAAQRRSDDEGTPKGERPQRRKA